MQSRFFRFGNNFPLALFSAKLLYHQLESKYIEILNKTILIYSFY